MCWDCKVRQGLKHYFMSKSVLLKDPFDLSDKLDECMLDGEKQVRYKKKKQEVELKYDQLDFRHNPIIFGLLIFTDSIDCTTALNNFAIQTVLSLKQKIGELAENILIDEYRHIYYQLDENADQRMDCGYQEFIIKFNCTGETTQFVYRKKIFDMKVDNNQDAYIDYLSTIKKLEEIENVFEEPKTLSIINTYQTTQIESAQLSKNNCQDSIISKQGDDGSFNYNPSSLVCVIIIKKFQKQFNSLKADIKEKRKDLNDYLVERIANTLVTIFYLVEEYVTEKDTIKPIIDRANKFLSHYDIKYTPNYEQVSNK
jgi:hypothetical protein